MKTEEMKNPETRGGIARGDVEIDLEKDGDKIVGGRDIPITDDIDLNWLPPWLRSKFGSENILREDRKLDDYTPESLGGGWPSLRMDKRFECPFNQK